MQIDKFLIAENATLREALSHIELNHHGIVMAVDAFGRVTGLATDGDIRRELLNGRTLDDRISTCINAEFFFEDPATPREVLLKKLDHRIRVIPLLDADRRLVGVVSRDHLPVRSEEAVFARARSPVRISFGGGGSDLTHFFSGQDGAVINTTISLYSHATLRIRDDEKITIHSLDLKDTLHADGLKHALEKDDRFGLIKALLWTVQPDFGFDLYLHSDFPMNSGLGGSAVVSAAILGCFNQFRLDQWDLHELAELAFQAERLHLGVAGGWQDQYATVFGGFNFIEFKMEQNIVHPLRIHPDILLELEESLILCDTGTTHDSGGIHEDQRRQMADHSIRRHVNTNVELSYQIRNQLLRGKLLDFGHSLHEAWQFKRQFSSKISTGRLDRIYEEARAHGALGGKLLGAGGGGFFLFYVPPFRKHELIQHLEASKLQVRPFRFEQEGLRAWTVREHRNHMAIESV
ncbi:sugar kinase [Laribacter hongkongensis]|uniref:GHMP family kinase ATP-binding protein n=1 Tax=Laribacter hongkongensis TaxID=168471 RepID=UPI001877C399|nr:CBS domain-containing protein [Laribacter hongkongensis]MBE5528331.1 sugar kinase [Laribacter hongkongensis]